MIGPHAPVKNLPPGIALARIHVMKRFERRVAPARTAMRGVEHVPLAAFPVVLQPYVRIVAVGWTGLSPHCCSVDWYNPLMKELYTPVAPKI